MTRDVLLKVLAKTHGVAVVVISHPDEAYKDVKADLILEDFIASPKAGWEIELLNHSEDEK